MTADPTQLGIPEDAMRRLAEMRPGQATSLFTSDLSVNEFLLVREAGFRPLGLVLGSSIYHVGFQMGRWSKNQELDTLSQAMYHARELAMTRMEAEADQLGADGIVGVRLEIEFKEFGTDLAEFIAVGTAVKSDHPTPEGGSWRNNRNQPFTSDLSGQDFWTLIQAGYAPLGMVMGTCVYHVAHQRFWQAMGNIGQNVELPQFTEALYDARELAMSRMQAEAEQFARRGHRRGAAALATATAGAATPPSSSRSAPRCARCAPTTTSRPAARAALTDSEHRPMTLEPGEPQRAGPDVRRAAARRDPARRPGRRRLLRQGAERRARRRASPGNGRGGTPPLACRPRVRARGQTRGGGGARRGPRAAPARGRPRGGGGAGPSGRPRGGDQPSDRRHRPVAPRPRRRPQPDRRPRRRRTERAGPAAQRRLRAGGEARAAQALGRALATLLPCEARMADAQQVRRLALALHGVEEIESDGFDFRVGGKGFVWSYPERVPGRRRVIRTDIAVLYVGDEAEKQALLLGEPELFFSTPAYDHAPLVMVRLDRVDTERIAELVVDAWRMRSGGD